MESSCKSKRMENGVRQVSGVVGVRLHNGLIVNLHRLNSGGDAGGGGLGGGWYLRGVGNHGMHGGFNSLWTQQWGRPGLQRG
jgi:hypothetical protein